MSTHTPTVPPPAVHCRGEVGRRLRVVGAGGLVLYAMLLAGIAVNRLGIALRIAIDPREALYGESIIYAQATRILRGQTLYQPIGEPSYSATAYGPLYYWLAAGLQAVVGPGFTPGRALSIVAGAVAAGLVGYLAAQRARRVLPGALAAGLFLATGFEGGEPWFALYKEDVLGIALALGALTVLTGGASHRRLIVAGMLASLAILTKQTLVAASVAGFACLLSVGWRRAALFGGVVASVVIAVSLGLEVSTHAFLTNTIYLNVNPFSREAVTENLAKLAQAQSVQVAIAGLFIASEIHRLRWRKPDLVIAYGVCSLPSLVGLAKVGSNHNYWIELAAPTSILATEGLLKITRVRSADVYGPLQRALAVVLLGLLCLQLVTYERSPGFRFLMSALNVGAARQEAARASDAFRPVLDRVNREPGDVLAEPLDVLPLTGHRIVLEPYIFSIMQAEGRWDAQPLVDRICRGEIRLLVLGYPLERADHQVYQGYPFWPKSVLNALRATMVAEARIGDRYVYVPARSSAAGCGRAAEQPRPAEAR